MLAILLGAFVLRAVAIDRYPGPRFEQMYQDESKIVTNSFRLVDGRPLAAHYPLALYYWLAPQIRALRTYTLATTDLQDRGSESDEEVYRSLVTVDPMPLYLLLRGNMLLFSMGIVALLFVVGHRIGGLSAGLGAASCAAVMPLFVLYSKMAYYDLPMTFWLLCAAMVLATAWKRNSILALHLGAALVAWSFTTKQNAVVLWPLWLAVALKIGAARRGRWALSWLSWPLWTSAILGLLVTLWAYPALHDPKALSTFISLLEERYYRTAGEGVTGISNWSAWLNVFWPNYAPRFIFVLLGLGLALSWAYARDRTLAGFVASVTLIYYLAAGRSTHNLDRTMLPLLPGLCLGAAGWLMAVANSRISRKPLAQTIVALLLLYPLLQSSIRYDILLSLPDTRNLATDWLLDHANNGAIVATEDYGPNLPGPPSSKSVAALAQRDDIKFLRQHNLRALGNRHYEALRLYDYVVKVDTVEQQARALLALGADPRSQEDRAKYWRLKTFRLPLDEVVANYESIASHLRTVHTIDPPRPPTTIWPDSEPLFMYGTLPGNYFIPDVYRVLFRDDAYAIGPRIDIMQNP